MRPSRAMNAIPPCTAASAALATQASRVMRRYPYAQQHDVADVPHAHVGATSSFEAVRSEERRGGGVHSYAQFVAAVDGVKPKAYMPW